MKKCTALVSSLAIAGMSAAGAFTLDAVGYEGSVLDSTPFSIPIPGYGSLVLEAVGASILPIDNQFLNDSGSGGPSLSFDAFEAVKVTFVGAAPLDVDFEFAGLGAGEYFSVDFDLVDPQAYIVRLSGSSNGKAGVTSVSWNAVPEPSSALLGLVGTTLLAFRRRR